MSNRSERRSQDSLLEAIRFALDRFKVGLWTAGPGHVQSYDPKARRAVIIPAVRRKFTDGTTEALPMLHNVPVLHPSGGGFSLLFPLRKGDPVLLVWCQRGIDRFKETYDQEDPSGGILEFKDAVALAGFGELTVSPENTESAILQTNEGGQALSIHPDKVRIVSDKLVRVETVRAEVVASESAVIDSPVTRHTGIVEAAGYRGLDGGAAKMVADIDMDGHELANAAEVEADGIHLTTHIHDGDSGGETSAPKE